jgi:hypothetical protein
MIVPATSDRHVLGHGRAVFIGRNLVLGSAILNLVFGVARGHLSKFFFSSLL